MSLMSNPTEAGGQLQCPSTWTRVVTEYGCGTCLKKFNQKKPWLDARDLCRAEGGDIVDISNHAIDTTVVGE